MDLFADLLHYNEAIQYWLQSWNDYHSVSALLLPTIIYTLKAEVYNSHAELSWAVSGSWLLVDGSASKDMTAKLGPEHIQESLLTLSFQKITAYLCSNFPLQKLCISARSSSVSQTW